MFYKVVSKDACEPKLTMAIDSRREYTGIEEHKQWRQELSCCCPFSPARFAYWYPSTKVPETRVRYVMRTASYNASDTDVDGLGAGVGERLMEEPVPMFPMELMGQLPDLEYVASLAGGKLIKGRLPILT